jgi:hypothetical protein
MKMSDPKDFDVFISYDQRDKGWATKFAQELEAQGVHAWFDEAQIAIGDRYGDTVADALRAAKVVAVVIGPNYVASPSSAFELGAAVGGNKRIIPIVTEPVGQVTLPSLLGERKWLKEPSPQAAGKAVADVVRASAGPILKQGY